MVKIAVASDIHGMIKDIDFPLADILILAGDLLPDFFREPRLSALKQFEYLTEFDQVLASLPYKHIIVVAGNHDWVWEKIPQASNALKHGIYLQNSSVEIMGLKIWGSPFSSWFWDWAFNLPKWDKVNGYRRAKLLWSHIPQDTNIVVVHGPPRNILDECVDGRKVGCPILRDKLETLPNLKLGVFGHIHHSRGQMTHKGAIYVNAAICTEAPYRPTNPVQVVEIN